MAFTAPHWPLHALPEDIERYRGKYMNGWDSVRAERYRRMKKMGILPQELEITPADGRRPDWESLTQEEKERWDLKMSVYAAMIDRMDQNIGKVLDYLEQNGQMDNTLVIFLSDNGGCHESTRNQSRFLGLTGATGTPGSFDSYDIPWANVSNTPFRSYKHWVHEGGIATPFIACLPGKISQGVIYDQPGHIIDLMPTFIELAGGTYPSEYNGGTILPMEGVSLIPALNGKKLKRKAPLFWEHQGNRAVRDGDWKLVSEYDNNAKKFRPWELYDMKEDRTEIQDLSGKYPERTKEMIEQFNNWAERAGVVSREKIDQKK
jgi:arylsulfatase